MLYPALRINLDGTRLSVYNKEEAYANPETIASFIPGGGEPKKVEEEEEGYEKAELKAKLEAAGIAFDKRIGIAKLRELVAEISAS